MLDISMRLASSIGVATLAFATSMIVMPAAAHGKASCADFERIVAAAPTGFSTLVSVGSPGTASTASRGLTGYEHCSVSEGYTSTSAVLFACNARFPDRKSTARAYESLISRARTCLSGWQRKGASGGNPHLEMAREFRLLGRGAQSGIEFDAFAIGEETIDGSVYGIDVLFWWHPEQVSRENFPDPS